MPKAIPPQKVHQRRARRRKVRQRRALGRLNAVPRESARQARPRRCARRRAFHWLSRRQSWWLRSRRAPRRSKSPGRGRITGGSRPRCSTSSRRHGRSSRTPPTRGAPAQVAHLVPAPERQGRVRARGATRVPPAAALPGVRGRRPWGCPPARAAAQRHAPESDLKCEPSHDGERAGAATGLAGLSCGRPLSRRSSLNSIAWGSVSGRASSLGCGARRRDAALRARCSPSTLNPSPSPALTLTLTLALALILILALTLTLILTRTLTRTRGLRGE